MSHYIHRFVLAALLITFSAASAFAEEWRVGRVNQPASYSTDGTNWKPLTANLLIPRTAWIKTGIRGRVQLRRDEETILYRANTTAKITHSGNSVRKTEIQQTMGRILLDVETRKYQHTTVKTPYLAAIVKGTKFDVYVGSAVAKVKVNRGVVEVVDTARGERVDVTNGQSVEVTANGNAPMQVNGRGRKAAVLDVRTGKPVEKGNNGIGHAYGKNKEAKSNNGNHFGNGNSNAGGNGNSNAGGNGKSNAGGNGKSNAGGNGKGKGKI